MEGSVRVLREVWKGAAGGRRGEDWATQGIARGPRMRAGSEIGWARYSKCWTEMNEEDDIERASTTTGGHGQKITIADCLARGD